MHHKLGILSEKCRAQRNSRDQSRDLYVFGYTLLKAQIINVPSFITVGYGNQFWKNSSFFDIPPDFQSLNNPENVHTECVNYEKQQNSKF